MGGVTRPRIRDDDAPRALDDWLVPVLRELLPAERVAALGRELDAAYGGSYWRAAVGTGATTDEAILAAVARRARMRVAATLASTPSASARVPELLARRYGVLPLTLTDAALEVATGNPYDLDCEQTLAFVAGRRVRMSLASPVRIAERLDEVYRPASVVERILASAAPVAVEAVAPAERDVPPDELTAGARERPIIQLVDHIVAEGIAARASDIHVESEEDGIAVRLRVDGVLRTTLTLPRAVGVPLVSRIKIMAGMDIADRLRPQGGHALVTVRGERVDLRVSTLPASHGEKVVIRVLDARAGMRELDELGLDASDATELRRLLATREGLILVTGPTGSGKTTTLYAALRQLLGRGLNIVTVEDPVEYRLPGIVQVQVNERAGLTFAAALRSILRQDPDVILVGEIRDAETATIAIQAALTGHLVFATLHTIDAASSVTRLHDLGIDPAKVATALRGVLAQRLVRRVCDGCATMSSEPVPSALWTVVPSGAELRRGSGCAACSGTGYRGRLAVLELLSTTSAVSRLVAAQASTAALRDALRAGGTRSLWSAGVAHVLAGITTADEVARVLEPDGTDAEQMHEAPGTNGGGPPGGEAYSGHAQHPDTPDHDARTGGSSVTRVEVGVVDVYVVDPHASPWCALALKRGAGTRCPGAWEAVHGHIESGETPEDAGIREVREETGLAIERLYNVTVHSFYLHRTNTVEMAVVFCAFAHSDAPITLGREHVDHEWLPLEQAADRYLWPRATQALGEIRKLLGSGDAGPAEDVLRVR